jgi:hypothetical protein
MPNIVKTTPVNKNATTCEQLHACESLTHKKSLKNCFPLKKYCPEQAT